MKVKEKEKEEKEKGKKLYSSQGVEGSTDGTAGASTDSTIHSQGSRYR
jgi:hypothetical protein